MITIILKNATYFITSYNTHESKGKHTLWATRATNVNMPIFEGTESEVLELKEALDYAIKNGEKVFEILE